MLILVVSLCCAAVLLGISFLLGKYTLAVGTSILTGVLGLISITTAFAVILTSGIMAADNTSEYDKYRLQYQVLQYEIEEIGQKEDSTFEDYIILYDKINSYNNGVEAEKDLYSSPWTGWFANSRVAKNLEVIDIPFMDKIVS